MADNLISNGGAAYVPPDLLNDQSTPDLNPDYFDVVITELVPDTDYALQFGWVFEDKTLSPYSASYDLHTNPITIPEVSNVVTSWSKNDLNITFDRPEETINGVVTNLADSFIITLTYNSVSKPFTINVDTQKTSQSFTLTQIKAEAIWPVTPNQYTGIIQTVNSDGTSSGVAFTTSTNSDGITGQEISDSSWGLTKMLDGYQAWWSQFTDAATKAIYDYTEVWQSTTQSGTYELVGFGLSPQLIVYYADLGTKYVKIRHKTKRGTYSLYSNVKQIKAADPSGYDANGPENTSVLSAGTPSIDSNGLFDFNYQVPFSWNQNADTTTLGYKVRWRINGTTDPYTYMSVPGRSTTTTNLFGVLAGKTYEVGLNVYDEYDNVTGTWSNTTVTVPAFDGSIKDGKYLKAGDMKLGYGIGPGNEANNKGLYLSPNNWWYIYGNTVDDNSARIKIGSSTDYISWNGSKLDVTGTINAKGGNFSGSVSVGGIDSSGQLRVIQKWDNTNPLLPVATIGIELGKLNQAYVTVPGATLTSGIYAFNKETSKYVLIDAADGSIRANNAYIEGVVESNGSVSGYGSNKLTIDGGMISGSNVISLEAPWIDLNATGAGTYVGITGGAVIDSLQVTGTSEFDQAVHFYGPARMDFDQTSYVGSGSTSVIRNIYAQPTLVGLTSSTGNIGDIWVQYS